ncbi:iron-containing alcohol dehydrogenase [Planococcus shixiaomingii]|uniref:iron-containing alcohol dehydrogenase n=1 Tax=Planococcus shixiaomingii TaxID=3058393 RepID=UPI00262E2B12|nr:iron-containing alcohol dehydrogenase [Planococcus sp. N022]WKA54413.1 iron-containing alcohol dehydrogenase [Planococcus sp. N022]
MVNYEVFRTPQVIVYARDAFERVGVETALRGKKALIVSDGIMQSLGNIDKCIEILSQEKVQSEVYAGVASEPTDQYVAAALALFKEKNCDVIISLGGGSCIDTAKAVAVLASNGGYIGEYMGAKKVAAAPPVPHIAIPTTAGTGSEVTDVTIIINVADDVKMMIKQPAFMPAVAIVDPMLSMSSPKKVTAATGVDALSHAIEAYLSKKAHPMTDVLALAAIRLIVPNLRKAYSHPDDVEAREAMSTGSMYAGMAFSNASVCLVHGMSRPIGALFHVPHGVSNAMLLPAVLEFSQEACKERLADIGRLFAENGRSLADEAASEYAVEQVKKLCLDLEIPNLKEWGIDQGEFENMLTKMASDALISGSPANNPRIPDQQEIEELYRVCYDYQFTADELPGKVS